MTREEAIKGLKVLRKDFSGYKPNEEMFDMAIKALEQEPKTGHWIRVDKTKVKCSRCDITHDKNVPTNGQRVLVCFNDGFILIGAYINYAEDEEDKEESFWVFDGEENFDLEDAQVTAWMPLPESYKAESEVMRCIAGNVEGKQ